MYFPHAFQKLMLATNAAPFQVTTTKFTHELLAGQMGVIDNKTNKCVSLTAAHTYAELPIFYLAQGSFHASDKLGPFHGGYKESVKSKGINARYVSKAWVSEPAASTPSTVLVGNAAGTLLSAIKFEYDTTYSLRVDIKGSPALRTMDRNAYTVLNAFTGCAIEGGTVNNAIVVEQWAAQWNADVLVNFYATAQVIYNTGVAGVLPTDPVVWTATTVSAVNGVYTRPAGYDTKDNTLRYAQLKLTGAYLDTTFGDASFAKSDNVDFAPVELYASAYEGEGQPCADHLFAVTQVIGYQGKGYGDPLLKELILSKAYEQESFHEDIRMREVLDENSVMTAIDRNAKYFTYHILHSIPRNSNPSSTMDADQYLIKIVTKARIADFETFLNAMLTVAGNFVQVEVI